MSLTTFPYRIAAHTRQQVIQDVQINFPHQDPAQIMELLDLYGLETSEQHRERVQIAILQLSNGNLPRLFDLVEMAKYDYRALLHQAERAYA